MVRGQEGLWDEYNKLRREVKHLVMEKKLNIWNGVVEKANEANKEFWSFVGRRIKGRKGGVEALRNDSGVSVTRTKGKLKVLQSHYQRLGSCSVDDANWKQEVDSKVNECRRYSIEHDDLVLDREIEIARCVRKLKNNKTGGSDGLVGELLKYGGSGMLFEVVWREELVPPKWREGLIV